MLYVVCNPYKEIYVSHLSNCGNIVITKNDKHAKIFKTEEETERYITEDTYIYQLIR